MSARGPGVPAAQEELQHFLKSSLTPKSESLWISPNTRCKARGGPGKTGKVRLCPGASVNAQPWPGGRVGTSSPHSLRAPRASRCAGEPRPGDRAGAGQGLYPGLGPCSGDNWVPAAWLLARSRNLCGTAPWAGEGLAHAPSRCRTRGQNISQSCPRSQGKTTALGSTCPALHRFV